jgi:hypothetical protein
MTKRRLAYPMPAEDAEELAHELADFGCRETDDAAVTASDKSALPSLVDSPIFGVDRAWTKSKALTAGDTASLSKGERHADVF